MKHTPYEQLLQQILINGKEKSDRTGTGTRSIFGAQMRFDLRDGFPLITTKKVHFRSIVAELIWFLSGSTNVKDLQAMGCTIWDSWRAPWPVDRKMTLVERVEMPYQPQISGIQSTASPESDVDKKLLSAWSKMMDRCYNESAHNFRHYGAKGVSVNADWHDPGRYISDAKTLPHWWYKQRDWNRFEMDKDYYGSNQYGPSSCIWLPKDENVPSDYIYAKSPSGDEMFFEGTNRAARALGVSASSLHRFISEGMPTILKANNKKMAGWEFAIAHHPHGLVRRELVADGEMGPIYSQQWRSFGAGGIDQIASLIRGIKEDPHGRRHIVSAWNPQDIPRMALAPCHALFQFDVTDGKLSCQLYQRSADMFLGVPFNIASYALLTHMVAQQCDLQLGDFIWTGGDCHIYSNHLDQVCEQLSRTPRDWPAIMLRKADDIFSYSIDDVELFGYDPHPAIKAPVAV